MGASGGAAASGEWAQGDDRTLLGFLMISGALDLDEVDWAAAVKGRSAA